MNWFRHIIERISDWWYWGLTYRLRFSRETRDFVDQIWRQVLMDVWGDAIRSQLKGKQYLTSILN